MFVYLGKAKDPLWVCAILCAAHSDAPTKGTNP
jgi:hypothetical protein